MIVGVVRRKMNIEREITKWRSLDQTALSQYHRLVLAVLLNMIKEIIAFITTTDTDVRHRVHGTVGL